MQSSACRILMFLLAAFVAPLGGAPTADPRVQSFAMPRYFEPNWGVADSAIEFVSRGPRYQAMFTKEGASFVLDGAVVQLRFAGAGLFRYEAMEPLASKSHYLAQRVANVPHYGKLRARGIYPGTDVEFYPKDGEIEFDLIVAPGADPRQIRMTFPGAERLSLANGELLVHAGSQGLPLRLKSPHVHQAGRTVASAYRTENGQAWFELGPYNPALPLVIDPVLAYTSFQLSVNEVSYGVNFSAAADATGVYISGRTSSTAFPVSAGALKTTPSASLFEGYVAKFTPDGSSLLFATYLGFTGQNGVPKLVLSRTGELFIGEAGDLPLTPGAVPLPRGSGGATLIRLNANGSAAPLVLGHSRDAWTVDSAGNILLWLRPDDPNFPPFVTPGAYNSPNGSCRLLKIVRTGTSILFSLRYGSGPDTPGSVNRCDDVAVDSQDRIWVSGRGGSGGLPVSGNALYASMPAAPFGFWGRVSADGTQLQYSSYLPTKLGDPIRLRVGPDDDLFLRGSSNDVAGSPGAFLRSPFQHPTFILRLSAAGALRYLTFLPIRNALLQYGAQEGEVNPVLLPRDMLVDAAGNVTVFGGSYNDSTFGRLLDSVTSDALSSVGSDYLVTMNTTGSDVLYATYLPLALSDRGSISAMAADGQGAIYFVGYASNQLSMPPTVTAAPTVSSSRSVNGFFGKLDFTRPAPSCAYTLLSNPGPTLPIGGGGGALTVLTGSGCPWHLDGMLVGGGFTVPVSTTSQLRFTSAPALGSTVSDSGGVVSSIATGVGPGTISYQFSSRLNEANPTAAASDNRTTFRQFGYYTPTTQPQNLTVTQPYQPCSALSLSPAAAAIGGPGGASFTDLDLPPACGWTATPSAPWLTLGRTSGTGGGRLSFTVAANAGALRAGTVTISTSGPAPNIVRTLIVNQAGNTTLPTLALSALSGTFPAVAATGSVEVLTQAGVSWNAYANESWVTITAGTTGTGPGSVAFSLLANPATTPRTALLTIGGQIFTVSQLGQACLFGLSPTNTVLPATGGTSAITVGVTGSTCPFTATTTAPWIAIAATTATSVSFTAGANSGAAERTGTIRIADQTFTVTQAGAACTYSLTQSTQTFFATAGNGSTNVVTPGGCPWVAASSDPWVTITSPASNAGPGPVTFNLTANPNPARRTASLFLGGQNFVVVQAGTNEGSCTTSVPSVPSVDADGITELTGELILSCTGVAAPVTTDLELTLNTPVTNALPDASLALNGVAPRLVAPNRLRWTGLALPAGASVLRVSTLRANASFLGRPATFQANPIVATLGFSVPLTITNPSLTVAQASQAVAFSSNAFTRPAGSALAAGLILFRETRPTALQPGARLRAVISNIPNGAELFLPVTPADGSARARLLSAAADGTGGTAVAGNRLNNTYALTPVTNGSAIATWEVLSADPLRTESFDFQILLNNALPVDLPGLRFLGSPAPVSDVLVSSNTAPAIRYRDPASVLRRSGLRLSSRIVSTTPAPSAKPGAPRALFASGSRVLFEATVANPAEAGQAPAPNARILGNLPSGLQLRTCPAPCAPVNGQPAFPLGNLAPGQSAQVTLEAEVGPGLADGTPLSFFASATSDEPPADLAVSSTSTTILVGGVPLSLVLTPANLTVPGTAGTAQLQLTTAFSTLAWTATVTSGASWLTISNPAGNGSATLNLSFTANPTATARQATIAVGSATVTITQRGAPPSVAATGPVAGSAATQTFTFRFTHPEGFQNLGVLNVLINRALDGGRACYIAYSQPAGALFLVNDNGPDAGLSAPLVLGSSANVNNSQCQINGTGSSAVGSGNVLTLTLNIAFRPAFAGNQVVYLAARDQGTGNSGWSTMGFHQVPGAPVTFPNAISMSPAAGTAGTGTVTFTYEDQTSSNNIQTAWALMNTALDGRSGCYVAYFAPGNILFLFPDDGSADGLTNMVLAGSGSIENSQCRINAQGSTVVRSGARLTLNLNMTFKPAFAGPKAVWLALQTLTAVTAPWKVSGAWQVPP